jgi:hypothetical protein
LCICCIVHVLHFIHKLHSCCGIRVNLCRGVQLLRRKAGRRGVNFVDRRLFDCDAQACRSRADRARAALYEQALVLEPESAAAIHGLQQQGMQLACSLCCPTRCQMKRFVANPRAPCEN